MEEVDKTIDQGVEPGNEPVAAIGIHSYRNKIKKQKKKFKANAKLSGREGKASEGTRLEGDEFNYFLNIKDAINQGFDSVDDKCTIKLFI